MADSVMENFIWFMSGASSVGWAVAWLIKGGMKRTSDFQEYLGFISCSCLSLPFKIRALYVTCGWNEV
jgi:hypothetical protein